MNRIETPDHSGRRFANPFTTHPAHVGETYLQHLRFASGFSGQLLLAAGAAMAHALLPFLFEKTASAMIRKLHRRIENR
jgi:hypothetical protein